MEQISSEDERVTVAEYINTNKKRQSQYEFTVAEAKAKEEEAKRQTLLAQIEQYDQVLTYLVWVIAAILINRHTTQVARAELVRTLCPEQYEGCPPLPDTWCMRLFGNLLLLYSLSYFYCLAYENNKANPSCRNQRASWAGLLVLTASFLSFVNLVTEPNKETVQEPED